MATSKREEIDDLAQGKAPVKEKFCGFFSAIEERQGEEKRDTGSKGHDGRACDEFTKYIWAEDDPIEENGWGNGNTKSELNKGAFHLVIPKLKFSNLLFHFLKILWEWYLIIGFLWRNSRV